MLCVSAGLLRSFLSRSPTRVGVPRVSTNRLLYDLFTNIQFVEQLPPLLVACHKADADGALSPADIRGKLEAALYVPDRPSMRLHCHAAARAHTPHVGFAVACTENFSKRRARHWVPRAPMTRACALDVRASRSTLT